jgi:hypothetical protein
MILTTCLSGACHKLGYEHAAVVVSIQIVVPIHIVANATLRMTLHELVLLHCALGVLGATLLLVRVGGVRSRCAGQQNYEREFLQRRCRGLQATRQQFFEPTLRLPAKFLSTGLVEAGCGASVADGLEKTLVTAPRGDERFEIGGDPRDRRPTHSPSVLLPRPHPAREVHA